MSRLKGRFKILSKLLLFKKREHPQEREKLSFKTLKKSLELLLYEKPLDSSNAICCKMTGRAIFVAGLGGINGSCK